MSLEYEEKEIHVYLDFQGKLTPDFFRNNTKLFLNIHDVDGPNPIVQLENLAFIGSYEDSIGTNVFFSEEEDPPLPENAFVRQTPIKLNFLLKQSKILKLNALKIPREVIPVEIDPEELTDVQFKEDYITLLEKFQGKCLNIEDIDRVSEIETTDDYTSDSEKETTDYYTSDSENGSERDNCSSLKTPDINKETDSEGSNGKYYSSDEVNTKYELLKQLAVQMMKRITKGNLTNVEDLLHTENFQTLNDLLLETPCEDIPILDEKSLEGFVDIEQSIKDKIISCSEIYEQNFSEKHEEQSIKGEIISCSEIHEQNLSEKHKQQSIEDEIISCSEIHEQNLSEKHKEQSIEDEIISCSEIHEQNLSEKHKQQSIEDEIISCSEIHEQNLSEKHKEESVEDEIISCSEIHEKNLSEKGRESLLSVHNIENMSFPVKLTFLINYLKRQKQLLDEMKLEECNKRDEYNRTPTENYNMFLKLVQHLENHYFSSTTQ